MRGAATFHVVDTVMEGFRKPLKGLPAGKGQAGQMVLIQAGKLKSGAVMVAQCGGPTAVINHTLERIVDEAKKSGAKKIYGSEFGLKGILGIDRAQIRELQDEDPREFALVAKTPGAELGTSRFKPDKEQRAQIIEIFREMGVRYFIPMGGDDTAHMLRLTSSTSAEQNYELSCILAIKTIDNDVEVTDHTPGYGSAALFVSRAITGIDMDVRSHPRAHIIVTMGKNAGFVAAASAVREDRKPDSGPHKIYVPEKEFTVARFLDDVENTLARFGRGIFVLAEGVSINVDGERKTLIEWLGASLGGDNFGGAALSGTSAASDYLVKQVQDRLKIKNVRGQTLGYEQRSMIGAISNVDVQEAQIVGVSAIRYAAQGQMSGSVALNSLDGRAQGALDTQLASLEIVGRGKKFMDAKFLSDSGDGISEAGVRYISQLIGEDKIPWAAAFSNPKYYKPGY